MLKLKNKKIRIGIAGCGWIAENAHIPAFLSLKNVEIISLFDINITHAQKVSEKYGINIMCDNFEEFLTTGIDAVVITTPNSTHYQYTIQTINAGKAVMCEKPFTISLIETEEILKLAKEKNVIVIPAFVNRFRFDVQRMITEILKNKIGNITNVDAGWLRKNGVPRPGTWFTKKEMSGGGVLIDIGSHVIDICLWIIKNYTYQSVKLRTTYEINQRENPNATWFELNNDRNFEIDVEDSGIADVCFSNNINLNVKLSWIAATEGDCTYFHIHGEKGSIYLKTLFGFSTQRLFERSELKICYLDGTKEEIYFDDKENNAIDAFNKQAKHFIERVRGLDNKFITVDDAFNTVTLIQNLYENEEQNFVSRDELKYGGAE